MNPITHFLISWNTAALAGVEKRDRILITLGGLLPDIDALGIIIDIVSPSKEAWYYYHEYHHQLTHNITTAVVGAIAVLLLANPVRGRSSQWDDRNMANETLFIYYGSKYLLQILIL